MSIDLEKIQAFRDKQAQDAKDKAALEAFQGLATNIDNLLRSLEKTGTRKLDAEVVNAVKTLSTISRSLVNVKVTSDEDIKLGLRVLSKQLAALNVRPIVNVPQPNVTVQERALDLTPLLRAIKALDKPAAKAPQIRVELDAVTEGLSKLQRSIEGLSFPVPNYVLPYKGADGEATQVQLDSSGNVPVSISSAEVTLTASDIEIGAVELKDSTTSNRATISAAGAVKVDGSAVTQPVSGTVTANLSATDNAVLDSIDTSTASKYITGIGHGVKTVTTAGTDVALAGSTACKKVTIQSQTDNTGLIAVGGSGVDATEATGTGVILYPGDSYEFDIDNLADVFIDATVNGEGVRYAYFT